MAAQEQWWFQDSHKKVFGPYKRKDMRAWVEEGRIKNRHLVSVDPTEGFFPVSDFYPAFSRAFLSSPVIKARSHNSMASGVKPPPPLPEAVAPNWYFLDQKHERQGPFTRRQMYEWLAEGYFELSLVVCDNNLPLDKFGWKTIAEYYPNYKEVTPFKRPPESNKKKLKFPEFVPAPPDFQNQEKLYPSEKKKKLVPLKVLDVFGNPV